MPFTVNMPKLSPTMEEGTIAAWHKKEGDFVQEGELLLEITTDKATVEHSALDEGYLRKILVQEGGNALLNQPIALFSESKDESISGYEPVPKKVEEKQSTPTSASENKRAPASMPPPFEQPSFVPELPLEPTTLAAPTTRIVASPLAKKIAKEKGLDLTTLTGSGPGGRITSKDLEKAQPSGIVTFGQRKMPLIAAGSFEEIPLTPMRKIIGKRLQESKTFIPHFYTKQIIQAMSLVEFRVQLKNVGIHVTFNDLVLRASAIALTKHPEINSGFNSVNQSIIAFKTVDISLAVTLEGGLITPIIRHADTKHLGELATEAKILIKRAREGKLQEQEYKGGSFTLSNLGMFGITEFSGVINPPQAAILAVGGISDAAVVKEGQITVGKQMVLTLSADHRVVDGAQAAQFMKTLQHLLENPTALAIS